MRTFDRLLRRARAEGGFSVVEVMLALTVLGIAMAGLAQLMGSSLVATIDNREREAGVALANEVIEEIRSMGYDVVGMKDGPEEFTDSTGTFTTLRDEGCEGCIVHSRSREKNGFTYSISTWVLGVDDAADGVGVADSDGEPVDYKRVVVDIGSTTDVGFSYRAETLIHDTTADPTVQVQGLSVEIRDPDNENRIVEEDYLSWEITIVGPDISGVFEEGMYNNFEMGAGSYTCTVRNTMSTQWWHPLGSPTADEETFPCSVVAGQIITIPRPWVQAEGCTATGVTNDLWIRVANAEGVAISGATVDPAPTGGQPLNPAATTTDTDGDAMFPGIWSGPYSLAVSASGYQDESNFVCLTSTSPTEQHLTVVLQPIPQEPGAEVRVEIKSKCSGTNTFKVALEGGPTYYEKQVQMVKDEITTVTLNSVTFGKYDIRVYHLKSGSWNKRKEDKGETFSVVSPPYEYGKWDISC